MNVARPEEVLAALLRHRSAVSSAGPSDAAPSRWESGVRPSMGTVGDAYDDAMCESLSGTLECELLAVVASAHRQRHAWHVFG